VVTSGQFLLDSESQLREAIEKMRGSTTTTVEPETNHAITSNESAVIAPTGAEAEAPVYVCPMPEHVSIIYDHAGNCPICGMALVPVTRSELKKIQPGGKVLYYTCPMPEHASVHEEKPGKCPLCGMTLIPVMAQPEAPTNSAPSNIISASGTNPVAKQLYTCPMHPEVVADQPGQCPKCGMDLVPVKSK